MYHQPRISKKAVQLLLFGLPLNEELEYAKKVFNNFKKGVILGFKISDPGSAIFIVPGYLEAIYVMKFIDSYQTILEGIKATLTAEEVLILGHMEENLSTRCNTNIFNYSSNLISNNAVKNQDEEYSIFRNDNEDKQITDCTNFSLQADKMEPTIKVFVGCLPKSATDSKLRKVFERFGKVIDVHILRDNFANTKYSAFVYYPEINMALEAIRNLDRRFIMIDANRPIEVRLAEKRCLRVPRTKDIFTRRNIQFEQPFDKLNCPDSILNTENNESLYSESKFEALNCNKESNSNKISQDDLKSAYLIQCIKYISQQGYFDLDNLTKTKICLEYCE